jgi:hypothetical protein
MTKHEPLENWLRGQDRTRLTLTFQQVESMLGKKLPASSYRYEAHWRGASIGRPGGSIVAAGWSVESIDWIGNSITIVCGAAGSPGVLPHENRERSASSGVAGPATSISTPPASTEGERAWQTFEAQASSYFSQLWGTDLGSRRVLVGGCVPKSFDLVSSDGRYIGDALQEHTGPSGEVVGYHRVRLAFAARCGRS